MNSIAIRNILHYMAIRRDGIDIDPLPHGRDFVEADYIKGYIYSYTLPNKSCHTIIATSDKSTYDALHDGNDNSSVILI